MGTNISNFIANLPHGKPTDAFDSPDASGSTSQVRVAGVAGAPGQALPLPGTPSQ